MKPTTVALITGICAAIGAVVGCEIAKSIFGNAIDNGPPAAALCSIAIGVVGAILTGGAALLITVRRK